MGRGEQALLHQVYPTELHGDTAVLKPRGDAAGFTLHAVSTEMAHVRELILSDRVKNLLVDLGYHRYFGSMVIGDLLELAQLVRGRGGRTGLCGISDDMESVLRLFQLEDQWEQFPSYHAALQSLANLSQRERMWYWRRPVLAAMVLMAAFLVYWFYPRPDYAVVHYEKLDALWRDVSTKRTRVGIEEWSRIAKKTRVQLTPFITRLESKVKNQWATPGEKYLLLSLKYHWLPWLIDENAYDETRDRQLTAYFLEMAHARASGLPAPAQPQMLYASSDPPDLMEPLAAPTPGATGSDYEPPANTPMETLVVPVSGPAEQGADAQSDQSSETSRPI